MSSSEESNYMEENEDATGDESEEESSQSEEEPNDRVEIKNDLKTMSFEQLMKLKEELGAKVYREAVLGEKTTKPKKKTSDFKRLNKNRPREQSSKRQVPFLGGVKVSKKNQPTQRDPRFDNNIGEYDPNKFKENYKFVREIREKEIEDLKNKLSQAKSDEERANIKFVMQRLKNKNVEEKRWDEKQNVLKEEQREIQKAQQEGRQPHFATKKEKRAKELVKKFVELKSSGALGKHLEKQRKKNAAKDRKKFSFD